MPLEVSQLCERLGWKGQKGFERLQLTPDQTIRDWVVIAQIERELRRAKERKS